MTQTSKREAFRVDTIARGLDHQRTTYLKAYGNRIAATSTSFEAGMPVSLDSSGNVIKHPGTDTGIFGVAKYNKSTTITAVVSAEPIEFPTTTSTIYLKHANLLDHGTNAGGLRISTTAVGGTNYTITTDFTYNSTNGTVTCVDAGSIDAETVVYAWYSYYLTAAELLADGQNFYNMQDDVSIQDGKVTVIEGPAEIFTTQYNVARAWAINDNVCAGNLATDSCQGVFDQTSASTNTVTIGRVIQLPTADDPYLGFKLV